MKDKLTAFVQHIFEDYINSNNIIKLNYKCPKGMFVPDSFSCGETKEKAKENYAKYKKEKKTDVIVKRKDEERKFGVVSKDIDVVDRMQAGETWDAGGIVGKFRIDSINGDDITVTSGEYTDTMSKDALRKIIGDRKVVNVTEKDKSIPSQRIDINKSNTTDKYVERMKNDSSYWKKVPNWLHTGNDFILLDYMKEAGVLELPKIADKDEMDKLVSEGSTELWRGVTDKKYAEEFASGELTHVGVGCWGSGIYTSYEPETAKGVAEKYAGANGYAMRMVLDKSAKIANIDFINTKVNNSYKEISDASDTPEGIMKRKILNDNGRWALLHGYDAIRIESDMVGEKVTSQMLILNRGKVIMEKIR